jgi:hypothetical protein
MQYGIPAFTGMPLICDFQLLRDYQNLVNFLVEINDHSFAKPLPTINPPSVSLT